MDWIFDLDGTLYSPFDHVWERMIQEMSLYFTETLSLPVTWKHEEQERLKTKWHTKQTIIAYLNEFELDFNELVNATHIPIIHHLQIQPRLGAETIHKLPGKKWVLTNSPESFAYALLKKLELYECFDGVFGIRPDLHIAKPHPDSYKRISVGSNVVMIEDWHENLVIPHSLGWKTVWFPEDDKPFSSILPPHVHKQIKTLAELSDLL